MKIKLPILLFLFLSVCFNSIFSQDTLSHNLLWEISGNGLKSKSYLFGTIHVIPKEDFFYPKNTEEVLKQSESVFFEVDMDKMNDMTTMFSVLDKIMMNDEIKLQDLLTENEYNVIKTYFKETGLPMMVIDRFKPMISQVLADPSIQASSLKEGDIKSYEMELMELAKTYKKKLEGLETIEFQLSIFDSIPYKDQAKYLYQTIASANNGQGELKELVEIYKSQNLNQLGKAINEDENGLNSFLDILLNERNKKWIPIMEKNMMTHPCFFAVGAGHLVGDKGLINLLRQNSYTVNPVN
jgi:uncharacterized protein YbaP (TraB family)